MNSSRLRSTSLTLSRGLTYTISCYSLSSKTGFDETSMLSKEDAYGSTIRTPNPSLFLDEGSHRYLKCVSHTIVAFSFLFLFTNFSKKIAASLCNAATVSLHDVRVIREANPIRVAGGIATNALM